MRERYLDNHQVARHWLLIWLSHYIPWNTGTEEETEQINATVLMMRIRMGAPKYLN